MHVQDCISCHTGRRTICDIDVTSTYITTSSTLHLQTHYHHRGHRFTVAAYRAHHSAQNTKRAQFPGPGMNPVSQFRLPGLTYHGRHLTKPALTSFNIRITPPRGNRGVGVPHTAMQTHVPPQWTASILASTMIQRPAESCSTCRQSQVGSCDLCLPVE